MLQHQKISDWGKGESSNREKKKIEGEEMPVFSRERKGGGGGSLCPSRGGSQQEGSLRPLTRGEC